MPFAIANTFAGHNVLRARRLSRDVFVYFLALTYRRAAFASRFVAVPRAFPRVRTRSVSLPRLRMTLFCPFSSITSRAHLRQLFRHASRRFVAGDVIIADATHPSAPPTTFSAPYSQRLPSVDSSFAHLAVNNKRFRLRGDCRASWRQHAAYCVCCA